MSQPDDTLCCCNCADGDSSNIDEEWLNRLEERGWSQCECRHCGTIQGCNVPVSDAMRFIIAHKRGKENELQQAMQLFDTAEEEEGSIKKNHPKLCEDCIDHGLLELRRQAVQRGRKRRLDEHNTVVSTTKRASHGPSETTPAR